jgi:hypothetical protein
MSELLSKIATGYPPNATMEEKACYDILFNDSDVSMGDKRLNNIAALTYNTQTCERIFSMIIKSLNKEAQWKTILKGMLLLRTIVLYGSELSIDKAIDLTREIGRFTEYNSALVKKGFFGGSGGVDYGGPVREAAKALLAVLATDDTIRNARSAARAGSTSLVPLGEDKTAASSSFEQTNPSIGKHMAYGQGLTSSVGAGFSLGDVPGLYEGRPERYFDNSNDPRRYTGNVQDAQLTRDVSFLTVLPAW